MCESHSVVIHLCAFNFLWKKPLSGSLCMSGYAGNSNKQDLTWDQFSSDQLTNTWAAPWSSGWPWPCRGRSWCLYVLMTNTNTDIRNRYWTNFTGLLQVLSTLLLISSGDGAQVPLNEPPVQLVYPEGAILPLGEILILLDPLIFTKYLYINCQYHYYHD